MKRKIFVSVVCLALLSAVIFPAFKTSSQDSSTDSAYNVMALFEKDFFN